MVDGIVLNLLFLKYIDFYFFYVVFVYVEIKIWYIYKLIKGILLYLIFYYVIKYNVVWICMCMF